MGWERSVSPVHLWGLAMSGTDHKWEQWNSLGGPKYPQEKVVQFVFRNYPSEVRTKTRVLDLGCGSGVNSLFLASEGFLVHGTDISQIGIGHTSALLDRNGLRGEFKVESIDNIGYSSDFFDCVLSIGVLDCAGPKTASLAIREVIRVLKKNGKAFLCFASDRDFRVLGPNPLGLHGYSEEEVEAMVPHEGLSLRWIDRYITTQRNQEDQQNDFLVTLQKK